jgi:hypothetical protein
LREQVSRQAGIVSRQQALKAGVPREAVAWRVRSERWSTVYPGIYATFGGSVSRIARLWAAVLYAGPEAMLSHQTAAELLRLTDEQSPSVHVAIPDTRRVRAQDGVVVHRSAHLGRPWQPLGLPPHTFIEDTIIDLVAAAASVDEVVALVTAAFGRRLASETHLRRAAAERARLRWRRELGEIIRQCAGGAHSVLEYRHDRDVQRAHGLPEPVRQARFLKPDGSVGYRDRSYPDFGGLVIELDGKRFHPDRDHPADTERDNQAAVSGATLRYDWDAVTRRACETARQQAEALRNRGWAGRLTPCSPRCRAVPATARRPRRDEGRARTSRPVVGAPA